MSCPIQRKSLQKENSTKSFSINPTPSISDCREKQCFPRTSLPQISHGRNTTPATRKTSRMCSCHHSVFPFSTSAPVCEIGEEGGHTPEVVEGCDSLFAFFGPSAVAAFLLASHCRLLFVLLAPNNRHSNGCLGLVLLRFGRVAQAVDRHDVVWLAHHIRPRFLHHDRVVVAPSFAPLFGGEVGTRIQLHNDWHHIAQFGIVFVLVNRTAKTQTCG